MSEEKIKSVIRAINEAYAEKRDVEKMLTYFTDEAIVIAPEGIFKGRQEIKRFYTWALQNWTELKKKENKLIVQGNNAALDWIIEGTIAKQRASLPGAAIYTFRKGKVHQLFDYYDRLSHANRLAKGFIPKRILNSVVKTMEKGLR